MRALAMKESGLDVRIAVPPGDEINAIEKEGFRTARLTLSRKGLNPIREVVSYIKLRRIIKEISPDIIFTSTIKPNLYGGYLGKRFNIPTVCSFNGLGTLFISNGLVFKLLRKIAISALKVIVNGESTILLFQNEYDRDFMVSQQICPESRTAIIAGSGVDVDRFEMKSEPESADVKVLLASRLLRDKGIFELIEAARRLQQSGVRAKILIAGIIDKGNPGSISLTQVEKWESEGIITWLGTVSDMPALYKKVHIVILPSYREGLPRGLAEAAACGRAIIATDVPGCNDVVKHGVNGLLIPVGDVEAIVDSVRYLVENPQERREMGRHGRELVERRFSETVVLQKTLSLLGGLLQHRTKAESNE